MSNRKEVERQKRMEEEKGWRDDPLKLLDIIDAESSRAWLKSTKKKKSPP